jgi:hypothetical protein
MKNKFVWDTSAIINIQELNSKGYSPGQSLYKDLTSGYIPGEYQNIFPSLAVFEVAATVSRSLQDGKKMYMEYYLIDENSILYDVSQELIYQCNDLFAKPGFDKLRGADLVFACIAHAEDAYLVTLDKHFSKNVSNYINVVDLNDSRDTPNYLQYFEKKP